MGVIANTKSVRKRCASWRVTFGKLNEASSEEVAAVIDRIADCERPRRADPRALAPDHQAAGQHAHHALRKQLRASHKQHNEQQPDLSHIEGIIWEYPGGRRSRSKTTPSR